MVEKYCKICCCMLNHSNQISLQCNPEEHYFCESCIIDWYLSLQNKKNDIFYSVSTGYFERMCPICKKDGGHIPCINHSFIPNIHKCKYILNNHHDYVKKRKKIKKKREEYDCY